MLTSRNPEKITEVHLNRHTRNHWGIENNNHYVYGTVYRERGDLSIVPLRAGPRRHFSSRTTWAGSSGLGQDRPQGATTASPPSVKSICPHRAHMLDNRVSAHAVRYGKTCTDISAIPARLRRVLPVSAFVATPSTRRSRKPCSRPTETGRESAAQPYGVSLAHIASTKGCNHAARSLTATGIYRASSPPFRSLRIQARKCMPLTTGSRGISGSTATPPTVICRRTTLSRCNRDSPWFGRGRADDSTTARRPAAARRWWSSVTPPLAPNGG
jgi:hypothetical protein